MKGVIKMAKYILPGSETVVDSLKPTQTSPLLRYYSPRLFGAPSQLTNQCDMRLLSSDGTNPGPVGDFYLTKILQDAQIVNFNVGRARFTGGHSTLSNVLREAYYYSKALSKYDIYGQNDQPMGGGNNVGASVQDSKYKEAYESAYGKRDIEELKLRSWSSLKGLFGSTDDDLDDAGETLADISSHKSELEGISEVAGEKSSVLLSSLLTSLSVQQPYYTFEADWYSYINNVKMMINTAVIMLGLQNACVRIGDNYYPIGMIDINDSDPASDAWANYRYITPTSGLGQVTEKAADNGDSSQYVSFMIDPTGFSESYTNQIGQSQIFSSVINSGASVGAEIAFLTNSTVGSSADAVIKLGAEAKEAAQDVMKEMAKGNGRFTAAIASSMARSYTGEHTIYPEVFQGHTSTSGMSVKVHLVADSGDAYSYLVDILVPLFFIFGLTLPQLSKTNASAYQYPPVIQANIPGIWGTRLGMIESINVSKNPSGRDVSINGWPTVVDVDISIKDLQHVMVTSPMNKPSIFLNNTGMFDYIAQSCGVDKYRVNGSMRTAARRALATAAVNNTFASVTNAVMNDWHSLVNRIYSWGDQ
jgi:hypothetical protein